MILKKKRVYKQILAKMIQAKSIALVSHIFPDLDTIGSACGWYEIIKNNCIDKHIDLICRDPIPEKYLNIPNTHLYQKDFNPHKYDLIIFFDASSPSQTGFDEIYPHLYHGNENTINIDHHTSNHIFSKQNIVLAKYSSTTMILLEICDFLFLQISPQAATCFLVGIYYDTGLLQHSNVDALTLNYVSRLLEKGADKEEILQCFHTEYTLSTLKLWGRIMQESSINQKGILSSYVNKEMLDTYHADYDQIGAVVDFLNGVEGITYCALLTQKGDQVRASLRTLRDDVDLSMIAKKYSGGGHKKSSGFTVQGNIQTFQSVGLK